MTELIASTLRLSTPLLFAATGGYLCERAGIATICLEGVMIMSAWTAAVVGYATGDPWLGALVAILAGMLTMLLHAFLSITVKADQIISGVVVNLLAAGLTPILNKGLFGNPTNSPSLPLPDRFQAVAIPGLDAIPVIGEALFREPVLTYLALVLPFALAIFIRRTRPGLRLLAAGDGPEALAAAGVSVARVRYTALALGGAVASLGGTYLAIAHASQFTRDMTAGRGYIALTALIFGKWRPIPTFAACLFFGAADAIQIRLQSTGIGGWQVPVQLIQAMPYLATLFVLVVFVGKARPPLAIGKA